jgi:hypothetical protein
MTTITYNGVIGYENNYGVPSPGIDGSGLFGPAGASIVGDHFWITWTGTPCNCIGVNNPNNPLHLYYGYAYPSPITDVTIEIGNQPYGHNQSYDFGPSSIGYGEFYLHGIGYSWPQFTLEQVGLSNGNISTSIGFSGNPQAPNRAFAIGETTGTFTRMAAGVPGPELGTGWPALILAVGLLGWWLWRKSVSRIGAA